MFIFQFFKNFKSLNQKCEKSISSRLDEELKSVFRIFIVLLYQSIRLVKSMSKILYHTCDWQRQKIMV